MENGRVCYVRNIAQKVLMDFELKGQFSDGHWENSRQDWKLWCDTDFIVSTDGKLGTVGIGDWKKRRARYNLSAKSLLEVVGDRMMAAVRVCQKFPKLADMREIRHAIEFVAEEALNPSYPQMDYAREYQTKVEKVVGSKNMAEFNRVAADTTLYTMKMMRKDLNDLKDIMYKLPSLD